MENAFISGDRLDETADILHATKRQVKVWFQNKRQRLPDKDSSDTKTFRKKRKKDYTESATGNSKANQPQIGSITQTDLNTSNDTVISDTNLSVEDFGLPVRFYFMLSNMDDESLHLFGIRCIARRTGIFAISMFDNKI